MGTVNFDVYSESQPRDKAAIATTASVGSMHTRRLTIA